MEKENEKETAYLVRINRMLVVLLVIQIISLIVDFVK